MVSVLANRPKLTHEYLFYAKFNANYTFTPEMRWDFLICYKRSKFLFSLFRFRLIPFLMLVHLQVIYISKWAYIIQFM